MSLPPTIHATCVAIRGLGVLLLGPPGSGKSDLALRLIDRGATLVADDRTRLFERDGRLFADAPDTIAGLIEVRGLGICTMPHASAPVELAVTLNGDAPRLPDEPPPLFHGIRMITLAPFEASAPIKLEMALERVMGG